ncbi:hypothetical protein GCM10007301_47980 [Azorhizobium oxalatiphilum]|uniref:Uncharacterized protein n=1 Tax=Azorhizobium oxalatiphilum TaxID=980631 RepID=A0A917FIF1_9HYPH|nr:hypothetical protein [Azorhizobium oxalatiphilum]GGF82285.1 hypothetical protein GCM10007301_47980 [Azorhizobium oxalatiphilum]
MASRRNILKGVLGMAAVPVAAAYASDADAAVLACKPRLDELEAAMDMAWEAYQRKEADDGDDGTLEDIFNDRVSILDEALVEMLVIPATTMEGLMFKAAYGRHYAEVVLESLANDLRAMQGLIPIYPDKVSPLRRRLAGELP